MENSTVFNNSITTTGNEGYGVYLAWTSRYNNISYNDITTDGQHSYGVHIFLSSGNNVTYNTISTTDQNARGIYVANTGYNTLVGNNITTTWGDAQGIYIGSAVDFMNLTSNTIKTSGDDADGILMRNSDYNQVIDNKINTSGDDAYGIIFELTSSNNDLISNEINTSGSSSYGIYLSTVDNLDNRIDSNIIITDGVSSYGIDLLGSYNNLTANDVTSYGDALYLSGSSNNNISSNTLNSTKNGGLSLQSSSNSSVISDNTIISMDNVGWYGINIGTSSHNLFISNNIFGLNGARGVRFTAGRNNTLINGVFTLAGNDIYIDDGEGNLTNVTINKDSVTWQGGATGNLTVNWYITTNISNSSGSPLQGVTVSVSNVSGVEVFSGTTDANGTIGTLSLNEFWENISDKFYSTPHTVNVSKSGYLANSTTINLSATNSTLVSLALNLSVAGGTLTLTETLEPSTVDSGATVYVSGNSSFVNGTGNIYSVINFSSGTDNITYHWFDNDTTDSSTLPFRWPFVLESSVTETNKPVIISGQDLLDSTPGLSLASIDINKVLIVDPDGTPTGNEENGHELLSTFNDLDSDGVFDATDYVNFTANITANTKKLLYLYDDPVENIPKIVNAYVDPIKVQPGDVMTITVEAEDDSGIKEVIAEMTYEGGSDLVNLELVEGTVNNGTWQGEWIVHDTLVKDYTTIITAINVNDVSSKSIIEWRDPTPKDCIADGSASSTGVACNAGTCNTNEDSSDATIDSCSDASQNSFMSVRNVYLDVRMLLLD